MRISFNVLLGGLAACIFTTMMGCTGGKKVYPRSEFKELVMGKSAVELLRLLGKPQKSMPAIPADVKPLPGGPQPGDGGYWVYERITRDPDSGRVDGSVRITFDPVSGKATEVEFIAAHNR